MSSTSFKDYDGNQRWPRQKGCVKEYNIFFDEAMNKLELPERYHVMTYVAGLKKEIADSICFFHPRTMDQAKGHALLLEMTIERQMERARKELEDQEKGGSGSTNTQECPVDHTAADGVQEEDARVAECTLERGSSLKAQEVQENGLEDQEASGSSQEEYVEVQESLGVDENSKNSSACFLGDKQTTTSAQNESSAMMNGNPTADMNAFDVVILGSRQKNSSTMEQEGDATLLRGSLSSSSGFVLVYTCVSSSSDRRELKRPVHWYDGLLRKWLSLVQLSSTQSLQHSWFRGALITMLCGRFWFFEKKRRRRKPGQWQTKILLETDLNFTWLRDFKLEKSNFQLSSIFSRVRSILKGTAGLQFISGQKSVDGLQLDSISSMSKAFLRDTWFDIRIWA